MMPLLELHLVVDGDDFALHVVVLQQVRDSVGYRFGYTRALLENPVGSAARGGDVLVALVVSGVVDFRQ
jgi:hypothetical protein